MSNSPQPEWSICHPFEGEELEQAHALNALRGVHSSVETEFHLINWPDKAITKPTRWVCQYMCTFCLGHQYERPEEELLRVLEGLISDPPQYHMEDVLFCWSRNLTPFPSPLSMRDQKRKIERERKKHEKLRFLAEFVEDPVQAVDRFIPLIREELQKRAVDHS